MKVYEFLTICSMKTEIVICDNLTQGIISHNDNKHFVEEDWLNYDIEWVSWGINGIDIFVNAFNVSYDSLNVEAKLNCLNDYVYKICGYERFDGLHDISELEECVKAFYVNSEYHLDKFGNWYDEENCKI